MSNYSSDIEKYRAFDPDGDKSVEEIASHFGWPIQVSYTYKYFLSELDTSELSLLDNVKVKLDLGILAAICIQKPKYKIPLLSNIERFSTADSPLAAIETFIQQIADKDPLADTRNQYWFSVGEYITERGIDASPFNKKAIGFIKSIGYNGYENLSVRQKQWITDLIAADKERVKTDRLFINEQLMQKGFAKECSIVENFEKCH